MGRSRGALTTKIHAVVDADGQPIRLALTAGQAHDGRIQSFPFSPWVYRQLNLVERFFSKLKQFRGIATRYDKDPLNFLAAVNLAAASIWIRSL
jgi:transposase